MHLRLSCLFVFYLRREVVPLCQHRGPCLFLFLQVMSPGSERILLHETEEAGVHRNCTASWKRCGYMVFKSHQLSWSGSSVQGIKGCIMYLCTSTVTVLTHMAIQQIPQTITKKNKQIKWLHILQKTFFFLEGGGV